MSSHYGKFAINLVISTVIMYLVMFSMINGLAEFYNNINMLYMALMMVAPMAVLMLILMRSMYQNMAINIVLYAAFIVVFSGSFWLIRSQTPIGDVQFLRSMIPHHSGAILMCREASISDPEISSLCDQIIQSQREEIDQMVAILERYQR
jgi:uncharacterized protein (DUF305 family)